MDGVLINTEPLHYQCLVEIFKERYGIDLDYEVYKPCIGSTRLHFMNLIKENYGITFESLAVMNQIMKEKKDEIIARDGFPEIPDAVLEITAWTKENIEKIMKFLHFAQEKVLK